VVGVIGWFCGGDGTRDRFGVWGSFVVGCKEEVVEESEMFDASRRGSGRGRLVDDKSRLFAKKEVGF
jgi:hypothetical protein